MSAEELDNLYQRLTDRLNELREERTEHEEILAFYGRVIAAQRQAQQETTVPKLDLTQDILQMKIQEGFPIIDRVTFPVDREAATRLFATLCQLSLEENPVLAGGGKALLGAMEAENLDFESLINAVLQEDSEGLAGMAADLKVESPVLQVLAKLSLQPSLLAAKAAVIQTAALDDWRYGYCPVCGSLPAMAALVGEGGQRQALCSFCGHIWRVPRLGCLFCSTAEDKEVHYFYTEGDDLYRVQVCDSCQDYLKTIDTRKGGDAEAMAVDDVSTSHLDLVAEEKGYQRKAPRLWGI